MLSRPSGQRRPAQQGRPFSSTPVLYFWVITERGQTSFKELKQVSIKKEEKSLIQEPSNDEALL